MPSGREDVFDRERLEDDRRRVEPLTLDVRNVRLAEMRLEGLDRPVVVRSEPAVPAGAEPVGFELEPGHTKRIGAPHPFGMPRKGDG